MGRTQGKQPGSAGFTRSQVIEPDVMVIPLSRADWITWSGLVANIDGLEPDRLNVW